MQTYHKFLGIRSRFLPVLLFLVIVFVGGYFRYIGMNWDANFHLHPDERFLTMVESSIEPVNNFSEYFDTQKSSLNPHNAGYGFFVYGTFPIFLVRYAAGWLGMADYNHVFLVGRAFSAFFDLLSIILLYLCAQRLYQNKWLSLIASALASATVLFIQQSHFFVVDSFANFFTLSSIYFSICILKSKPTPINYKREHINHFSLLRIFSDLKFFIFFGISLGLSAASKINTLIVACLLPLAVFLNDPTIFLHKNHKKRVLSLRHIFIAALISFIIFRIFQPYAFNGPGFFNISLNPKWIENLKELSFLSSGESNYPPSLQWARRPVWFGLENMVLWGMGIPLGAVFILSFLWMGKKIFTGEWISHLLIWLWTAVYLIWQSLLWNPTMRYFLPVYSTAIIIAAWGLTQLWDKNIQTRHKRLNVFLNWLPKILVFLVIISTFIWAFAFTRIYTRPVTRVSASEWIYQNINSAVNLSGYDANGKINLPLTTSHYYQLSSDKPLKIKFTPAADGFLQAITIDHIVDLKNPAESKMLTFIMTQGSFESKPLLLQDYADTFSMNDDPRGRSHQIQVEVPPYVKAGDVYFLQIFAPNSQNPLILDGNVSISISNENHSSVQPIYLSGEMIDQSGITLPFVSPVSSIIDKVNFFRVIDWSGNSVSKSLSVSIADSQDLEHDLASEVLESQFLKTKDFRGSEYSMTFEKPIRLEAGHMYVLKFKIENDDSRIAFYGSQLANESSWDDSLPLAMYGYNPFDYQTGIYQSDLNFEMYWDENQEKLTRFKQILAQADYIYISSNRQWGSITQIPERYPLSIAYYRNLLGCPEDKDIQWCYRVAEPEMFIGKLGFKLVKVFQSEPNLGKFWVNTQFAEEAFTVYDHPKVFIFKKEGSFSNHQVEQVFSNVDLTKVINLTPKEASKTPGTLTMPAAIMKKQYSGGTWRDLYNLDSLVNSNSIFALVLWYLLISLIGLINYPLLRLCFKGLMDKGYPVHKLVGMLLLALLVWLAGSIGVEVNKVVISIAFLLLLGINGIIWKRGKDEIIAEVLDKRDYFLRIEIIALFFFLLFLSIRVGNPDLWHPYKGGEKPMDFSYFNAILKSSVFPPYDPWYAGGYLNYYYFGFVIAGVPVKWLGINPSVAYNFILPSFFSFTAMGAFSIGWNLQSNLFKPGTKRIKRNSFQKKYPAEIFSSPYFWGVITAVFLLILGNLGTVRMIFHGFQRLASGGISIENGNLLQRFLWSIQGLLKVIGGQRFDYYLSDWYWIPSRAIPGESITEFPFFTFLYGDPHAHLFSLPITLIALLWGLSILLIKDELWRSFKNNFLSILFGSIVIGALKVTNTWDFPIFLAICLIILGYKLFQSYFLNSFNKDNHSENKGYSNLWSAIFLMTFFIAMSMIIYYPFSKWYGQAYTSFEFWNGSHTPLSSYLTHWGYFFFITVSWWIWELWNWMANTPLSVLRQWLKFRHSILFVLVLILIGFSWLVLKGIEISWIVIPLILLGLFIFFNQSKSDIHRFIDLLSLVGWGLTLMVEVIVLKGDIGRMNTVFKFYLQAWTLIAVTSSCYALQFIPIAVRKWSGKWKQVWLTLFAILLVGTCLYPISATIAKITDRMSNQIPLTFDGMDYMKSSTYSVNGATLDLYQDYQAIRWMQMNVKGSPVIVEANVPEYQWGNRFTVYTGLPGVVGWNWHQRQQRAILPSNWVTDRIEEIHNFYTTNNLKEAEYFIQKYQIKYIVVGQLEKISYPGIGLDKFETYNNVLWKKEFEYKDTSIYSVIS